MIRLPLMVPARELTTLRELHHARGEFEEFQRMAFAAAPLEVRLFDGRRPGQERFPQVDADATGVP